MTSLNPGYVFINQTYTDAGTGSVIGGVDTQDVLVFLNDAYGSLDLSVPFGTIVSSYDYSNSDDTTGGVLNLTGTSDIAFTTTAAPLSGVTPEPASLLLLSTGLTGTAVAIRRRRLV